jgi:hypothetical protein
MGGVKPGLLFKRDRQERHTEFWLEDFRGRGYSENLGINLRTVLKRTSENLVMKLRIRLD